MSVILNLPIYFFLQAEKGFYYIGNGYYELLKKKFYWLAGNHTTGPRTVEVIMGRKLQVSHEPCYTNN